MDNKNLKQLVIWGLGFLLLLTLFNGVKSVPLETEIPYSERVNRKARLRTYPVVEANGLTFVWYHPDETVAPMWELPVFPEFTDDADWAAVTATSYEIGTTW